MKYYFSFDFLQPFRYVEITVHSWAIKIVNSLKKKKKKNSQQARSGPCIK